KFMITRSFVKKLATCIRETYGKEIKHTDAIGLVANSLGWEPDALMHKLKQAERKKVGRTSGEPAVNDENADWIEFNPSHNKLIYSFFSNVVRGDIEAAGRYAPLIPRDDAWCCLAMAFYTHVSKGPKLEAE